MPEPLHFTAAQIGAALGRKPQAIRKVLRDVAPTGVRIASGQEAAAWSLAALPAPLRGSLDAEARLRRYRDAEALLTCPPKAWQPALPLNEICSRDIERAGWLRDALRPSLLRQHASMTAANFEAQGVADYAAKFGHAITARHWRTLFQRTLKRDAGAEDWNRLEIYLPDKPRPKNAARRELPAPAAEQFQELAEFISACGDPARPNDIEQRAIWTLAFEKHRALVAQGMKPKKAARLCRAFLFSAAPSLAPSQNALWMAFDRRLKRFQPGKPELLEDGRKANGNRAEYPAEDIDRIRHSASFENGTRIDAAWREAYPLLSEYTRRRHPNCRECPPAFRKLVSRELVDGVYASVQGKRATRKLIGGVTRNADNIPAMAHWAVDDMTSPVEVAIRNRDGTVSLIQPQLVAALDFASRKFVGWAISNEKGPSAKLSCAAILDGFARHGVCKRLYVENGFVFGNALNINGKVDEEGRTVVAGLAQYGCSIPHFNKMSPTSKGELEKAFDLLQRLLERHPGYGGRNQAVDASEAFKLEQRLIRSGKATPEKFRYMFDEFVRVMGNLIEQYNRTPQYGLLAGVSPNEAFEALRDQNDPPIKFDNQLHWILANERYRVPVHAGGVTFRHYGQKIRVRGGELPQHIGEEMWALVDREDASIVTFMSLDYNRTFTVEACQHPSADEIQTATGAGVLAAELEKIGQHRQALEAEAKRLKEKFGDPRRQLLAQIRNQPAGRPAMTAPGRRVIVAESIATSAAQMLEQRQAIVTKRRKTAAAKSQAQRFTQRTGIVVPESAQKTFRPEDARTVAEFLRNGAEPTQEAE